MKKWIAAILVLATVLALFCGCGNQNKTVKPEKAEEIAIKAAGVSAKDVSDLHNHVVTEADGLCYNIHFSAGGKSFAYLISSTGEILSGGETDQPAH